MKWLLYNLGFALVFPALLPGFLVRMLRRGGYRARMGDRIALYPAAVRDRFVPRASCLVPRDHIAKHDARYAKHGASEASVWIHAVSVGEVQVALQLMREWRRVEPGVWFCFSTTSSTGWRIAESGIGPQDVLIYNPLDFPNFVKSALRTVQPRAIVLTESEIWPVFIRRAKKMGIPLFLINARISDRSAPRYRFARWFFKDVFSCFTRIFAQSRLDEERLVAAGAPPDIIDVTGSFKFDVAHRNSAKEAELLAWLRGVFVPRSSCLDGACENEAQGTRHEARILLGASTWPGEDEVLLDIYAKLPDDVVLVIAPRHFEKADAVEANIVSRGYRCIRRSRSSCIVPRASCDENRASCLVPRASCDENRASCLVPRASCDENRASCLVPRASCGSEDDSTKNEERGTKRVFLADTTGELMGLYGIADAVFVGKSLCEHGSQNMIEPCLCGKPTLVGPYTENFRPVMSDLLDAGAIVQVKDKDELCDRILHWFSPEGAAEAKALGERAAKAVASRVGVVSRALASIAACLVDKGARHEGRGTKNEGHGMKKRSKWLWLIPAAIIAALAVVLVNVHNGGDAAKAKFDEEAALAQFRYKAIPVIAHFLARIEKPDAVTFLEVEFEKAWFDSPPSLSDDGGVDAVFIKGHSKCDWEFVKAAAKSDAAVVWMLDVRKMTKGEFKQFFDAFPCPDAHLWMLGESEWVLSGRLTPASVDIGDMLELFWEEKTMETLADAQCDSLPEVFANYAGDRMTTAGAFKGDQDAIVAPEDFVTQDIPDVGWVAPGDIDDDILESTAQEMRSLMLIRRSVIEGNMLAKAGRTDDAIDKWANAMLRNPHETMLLSRLHRLAVNATTFENVGNISAAAKCYETMLCVRPKDIAAIRAYANCLRRLGKPKLADDVMQRAKTLEKSL